MATYRQYENTKGLFWEVRGYLGTDEKTGKRKDLTKRGFKTKDDAQRYFKNAVHRFEVGELERKTPKYKLSELYHEWLEIYEIDVTESTLNKTKQNFRIHILPIFGDMYIDKITSSDIQKAVHVWHGKLKLFKNIYNYLKRLLEYAKKHRYIKENPCEYVILPKKAKTVHVKKTLDFYTKAQLADFFEAVEQMDTMRWYAFFRILAFTGCRKGEALALTWNDVNWNTKEISINKALKTGENNHHYIGETKNESSNRVITVDEITLSILKDYKGVQAERLLGFGFNALTKDQLMFSKYKDNLPLNPSAPNNAMRKICDRFDLPMMNIHGFRHTHCSLLFESGASMKDVKERLGHSNIETTMDIYTHVTQEAKDKTAQMFANYVNF